MSKSIFFSIFIVLIIGVVLLHPVKTKPEEIAVDPIALKVSKMSLDEKIGQLLIIGFEHPYIDEHIRTMITKYGIGGINLLGRNITSREQTIKLMSDLQALSSTTLFLATDQEGGKVIRFSFLRELTAEPKIKTVEQAHDVAYNRGLELKSLGLNMNFAPVLDYVSDKNAYLYSRTFATTPEITGELGSSMIKGYKESGIVPVAKHFPGYGNIKPDPHRNAAVLYINEEEFEKFLFSFKAAINEGNVRAIMTAHIIIPSIDTKPATVSPEILTDILRKQLGFNGVIITDDIEMISAGTTVEKTAVDAIKAGADMIISTYTPEKHISIFNDLKTAIREGEISLERLDTSVYRILLLKSKL